MSNERAMMAEPHWIYWNGMAWSFNPPAMWEGRVIPEKLRKFFEVQHGEFLRATRSVARTYGILVQCVPSATSPNQRTAATALNAAQEYQAALIDLGAAIRALDSLFHVLEVTRKA